MPKSKWSASERPEGPKREVNQLPGKKGFSSKEEIIKIAKESTAQLETLKDTAEALGMTREVNLLDFTVYLITQLQMIPPEKQKIVMDRVSQMCAEASVKREGDTGSDIPAVAARLFNDQLERQNDLIKKFHPSKAAEKQEKQKSRKVYIVRQPRD